MPRSLFPPARAPRRLVAASLFALAAAAAAQQGETVKIAWIDPLSGLMAPIGENQVRSFRYVAETMNRSNPAGVRFEIIPIDNKLSVAETLNGLKSAIDQGARYVTLGDGSSTAAALIDAVDKHNARDPGREVLFMNYAAVDPELTNAKCSYWHFRLDADTSMKMEALTTFMQGRADIHKVFLVNQNYAHGQQVSRLAKDGLARKRPDVRIVGDDLHPLAQVRDFAPYVAKIRASGADTVITGNWGSDLTLLVKAAGEAGLDVKFYTFYANAKGTPTALGAAAAGKVFAIAYSHPNMGEPLRSVMQGFKAKYGEDFNVTDIYTELQLLAQAMANAKSTDPVKVAAALEGLRAASYNGPIEMRKADHQLQQSLTVSVWQKVDARNAYSVEDTGYTFAPVQTFDPAVASTPTTCQMKRPA